MAEKNGNGLTLLEIYRIIVDNKTMIGIISLIFGIIAAIVVFFIMDPIFFSSGSVKTTSKPAGLGGLVGSGMPDLADIGDLTGGSSSTAKELALYESILSSRRCIEETLNKFKLNDEWEIKYFQDAVKHFRENIMDVKKDKIAGTLEIGIYDKYPERAKEITDFLIFQLNKINTELNIQNARNNREFIESRYDIAKADLRNAEDSLKKYQDIHGLAPDITLRAASQAGIALETEIKAEEVKLELLRKILSSDQAEIKAQEDRISALRTQLSELYSNQVSQGELALKGAPDVVLNFMRLQRSIEIQNKILSFIVPLYEQSKIEERKETPSVIVLDQPFVPERKVKPRRIISTAIWTFLGFMMSTLYYTIKAKWRNVVSSNI